MRFSVAAFAVATARCRARADERHPIHTGPEATTSTTYIPTSHITPACCAWDGVRRCESTRLCLFLVVPVVHKVWVLVLARYTENQDIPTPSITAKRRSRRKSHHYSAGVSGLITGCASMNDIDMLSDLSRPESPELPGTHCEERSLVRHMSASSGSTSE